MRKITSLFTAAVLLSSSVAYAQSSADALWAEYERTSTVFSQYYAESENADPQATGGNRVYRRTITSGEEFIGALSNLLTQESGATEDERTSLLDGMLTTTQVIGSMMVEIGECETGRTVLDELLNEPGIADRPIVERSADEWLVRADACIERQQLAAQQAEREREIAELERQLREEENGAAAEQLREELAEMLGIEVADLDAQRPPVNIAPLAVAGTGVALLLGGMIWDISLSGDRSTVDDFRDSLDFNEREQALEAADTIDGAKAPIGILYGVGAAAAIGGIIWYSLNPRLAEKDLDESVVFAPTFLRGGAGLSMNARF